jgi:excisionase family DNA binding protein
MNPEDILDRAGACEALGISRQTLLSWIRKGKIKVWKRVGQGSNAALLFHKEDVFTLIKTQEKPTTDIPSPVGNV